MLTIEREKNRHARKRQALQTARVLLNGGDGAEEWVANYRRYLVIERFFYSGMPLTDHAVAWYEKAGADLEQAFGRYEEVVTKAFKKVKDLY